MVTSQADQASKPLPETWQKLLSIRKGKLFENTARRIFYQDKISKHSEDPNAYSASVVTDPTDLVIDIDGYFAPPGSGGRYRFVRAPS